MEDNNLISVRSRYKELLIGRRSLLVASKAIQEDMLDTDLPLRNLFDVHADNARQINDATIILQELWREYGEKILPD